ncbi:MAG: hypothetical protein ABI807_00125 [Sporichthyaceae bacterium]
MTWCWFARVDGTADVGPDALAAAPVTTVGGDPAGALAAWPAGRKPVSAAVRMDERLVDPDGDEGWVSLVLLPRGRSPLFDDPAVSGALRAVLSDLPADGVSTLVRDSSHFAGAVTVRRTRPWALRDDPFARLGRPALLRVGPGLFGRTAPVPGPVTQRYSGQPWPAAGF